MKFTNALTKRLRDDRGEGAIATVAGSILFILASTTIAGVFGVSLAATALAQSNQQLTVALETDVQNWERTAWSDLAAQAGTVEDTISSGGREYNVTRVVEFKPEITAYTMTVSAPRAVAPGETKPDCSEAGYDFVDGCMALSGSIIATPDDVQPSTPAGITIVNEDIDGAGAATNLVTNPGFETGALGAWTGEGNAAVVTTEDPRSAGTHNLVLSGSQGAAGALSNRIDVTPGDQLQAQIWVKSIGTTGAVNVSATFWDGNEPIEVPIRLVQVTDADSGWFSVTGTVNAPAGANTVSLTARTSSGSTECDSECSFILDDATMTSLRKNLAPNTGLEDTAPLWSTGTIVDAENPTTTGTRVLEFTGSSARGQSVKFDVTPGTYVAEVSVRNTGSTGGTGTVSYSATLPNGQDIPISIVPVSGIGLDWVRLNGTIDIPVGVSSINLSVLISGAEEGSKLHFDDFSFGRVAVASTDPSINGYIRVAALDLQSLKSNDLRLSFQYVGAGEGPTDLKVAVFCSAGASASSVTESVVTRADGTGGDQWYWSRVKIAALDRLAECDNPDIRIYAAGGNTPDANQIGSVSVLAVLPTPAPVLEDD